MKLKQKNIKLFFSGKNLTGF